MKHFFLLLCSLLAFQLSAQKDSLFVSEELALGPIKGTLTSPVNPSKKLPLVILLAGSGPTDRDGNNPMMKNNSLKMVAEALSAKGIAVLRYDKRLIAKSQVSDLKEADLRFDTYINDVSDWITKMKAEKKYAKIIIAGHSEGSLIGMVAAHLSQANAFISIAGAGDPADQILKKQLSAQPKMVQDLCFPIIDSLKAGKLVSNVSPMLNSLFRASVQPYLISWFKYNPATEIAKLKVPTLIIQGTNDIQISTDDANTLYAKSQKGQLLLIENMNHVLKIVPGDKAANIQSYSNPSLPLSTQLVDGIVQFVQKQ
jgi:predicted alpha/beta-hydrolase family hydrolase